MTDLLIKKAYRFMYKNVNSNNMIHAAARKVIFNLLNYKYRAIKLHVNNDCNLKCRNCYCRPGEGGEALKTEEIFRFIDQLRVINQNLNLHILGGEPLLRQDLFEITNYAGRKLNKIILFTNATLISPEIARKIKESRITAVIATLHSSDKNIHDGITGEDASWERTVSGMRSLIKAGVPTYSFTVMMSCNAGHLDKIEHFVKGLGAKTVYLPYIKQCPQDGLCITDKKEFQEALSWMFNKSGKYKNKLLSVLNRRPKTCSAFVSMVSIKSDGTLTPCPFLNLNLGSIREEKFYSILERAGSNKDLLEFLSVPGECGGCSLVDVCGGGCKAFRYNTYHDATSKDENCRGPFKEGIPVDRIGSFLPYVF